MAKKTYPKKRRKKKEKNSNKRKNKQTTNQKHNTPTQDIIPTHKQHIKEKLSLRNTRFIQIGQNTKEQSPPPPVKKHFPT